MSTFRTSFRSSRRLSRRAAVFGFTLIELLVVIGIMTAVAGVVFFNQNVFRSSILLGNLTYDVALSLRQAQTYGIATRGTSDATPVFTAGYGVHFDPAQPTRYVLFADIDNNQSYAPPDSDVQTFLLQGGYEIAAVCYKDGAQVEQCSPPGGTAVSIVFKRPDPDALITAVGVVGGENRPEAKVILKSPNGDTRYVNVQQSGQISIQQGSGS